MRYYTYAQDLLHIFDNPRAPRMHRTGSGEGNVMVLGPTSSITDMPKADLQDIKTSDMDLQDSQDSKTSDMDLQDFRTSGHALFLAAWWPHKGASGLNLGVLRC